MDRNSASGHHRVIVVGTGFAGIGMAIRLREQGLTDFIVLERADDIGGTWRDNTYPGAASDVPSHLYSFSFALNPGWSRSFSGQQEIWDVRCRIPPLRTFQGWIRSRAPSSTRHGGITPTRCQASGWR